MSSTPTPTDPVGSGSTRGKTGRTVLTQLLVVSCFFFHAALARAGDYKYTSAGGEITITGYTGPGGAVIIPETIDGLPVTHLGDQSFYCLVDITSVVVPTGVVGIGKSAFSSCPNLAVMSLPSTITSIGDSAFASNPKLVNLSLPGGLLSLGNEVFSGCLTLETISIPASVTSMGTAMFKRCRALTSATLLANVANIGVNAFEDCTALASVSLPASLTTLPYYSFYGCSKLTSVTIPAGVTTIGAGAFYGCGLLPAITIPGGVTSIGDHAFRNCYSLTNLTLLGGVQTIGYYAFSGCLKLTAANFAAGLTDIGDFAFSSCQALASVTLPNSLAGIGNSSFASCSSLANVTIPASVTSIGTGAFALNTSSSNFTVAETNPNYRSLDGVLYNKSVTRLMAYPGARAGSFTIPDGMITIDPMAFWGCAGLTGISLPSGVTTIGETAFASCPLLENVTIPSSVSWIGSYAFLNCGKLGTAYFTGDAPPTGSSVFDSAAPGFTVFYQQGVTGFSSPLWKGYPAVALTATREISIKGPLGENLVDGNAAVDFGYLLPGASVKKVLTIANAGATPLTITAAGVDGSASAEFTVGNSSSTVLSPGMSTTITVTFTAGPSGTRNAALHLSSDDEDESPFDVQLSGICTPTPVPEITVFQPGNGALFEDGASVLNPGTAEVGTIVVAGILVKNTGTGDMHGLGITLNGANAGDFSFTSTPPAALAPGSSFSCVVTFSPKALGTRTAQLHIASDDSDENPFDITLSGIGKAPPSPEIVVEPATGPGLTDDVSVITFDPVDVGSQSVAQDFTIRNQGNAALQNISMTKDGEHSSDFIVSTLPKTSLLAGEKMTFAVRFSPGSAGVKTAALRIYSNDADENPFGIQLSGTTTEPAPEIGIKTSDGGLMVDGSSGVSFGWVELDESQSRTFTVTNGGTAALTDLSITVDGEHAADFIAGVLSSTALAPGGQTQFTVNFTPGATGDRSARLHVTSNDSDESPFDIDLTGTGVPSTFPEIAVTSPTGDDLTDGGPAVSLGTIALKKSVLKTFYIRNTGTADLTNLAISKGGPGSEDLRIFASPSPSKVSKLSPQQSMAITVTFGGKAVGERNMMLHIQSNDADEALFDIPLSVTVLALPEIDVQQPVGKSLKTASSSCSFGSVKMKSSSTKVFVIRNLGGMDLNVTSVTKTGPHAADFIVTPPAVTVVAPGASAKFKVAFSPSAKGDRKAVLRIRSSDANEASFEIALAGKGAAASTSGHRLAVLASPVSASKTMFTRESAGGLKYLTLTVLKDPGTTMRDPVVEVSSNLVDWYSGPRHTTVLRDGARELVVRDNTPDRPDDRRYIRLRPVPAAPSSRLSAP